MLAPILDRSNTNNRRLPALSKLWLGWGGSRNTAAPLKMAGYSKVIFRIWQSKNAGYLLDMSNHQQIRY